MMLNIDMLLTLDLDVLQLLNKWVCYCLCLENMGYLFQIIFLAFVPKANVIANHSNEEPHHNIDTSS